MALIKSFTRSLSPLTRRRLARFQANRRAVWSLRIFLVLFTVTLFAEFLINENPLLVRYDGKFYFPVFQTYSETTFDGDFDTPADYNDPFVQELIDEKGWILFPIIPYSYNSIIDGVEAPSPPSTQNWLGTDENARDLLAVVVYGFRISVLFGFAVVLLSSLIGVLVGALQGYFGGWVDLLGQRFMEIWGSLPVLYMLIILSSFVQPNFAWLLLLLVLFGWMELVGYVRAEFFRARNFDYVRAAQALGVPTYKIIVRHILPNAMVSTMTFMPFMLAGSVTILSALDFLGFGMPPGSPSLGELVAQGKINLQGAPWIIFTAFTVIALMLGLMTFIGEGVRDAFDPRKGA